jgi:aminopeptidase N
MEPAATRTSEKPPRSWLRGAGLVPGAALLLGSCASPAPSPGPGVSLDLARERAASLTDLRYDLRFEIPPRVEQPIRGRARVEFRRSADAGPLVLDFAAPPENVLAVRSLAGAELPHDVADEHVVIPASALEAGPGGLEIEFVAGDASLNRQEGFVYTLFVPARARLAFPCFDQPDLKARYRLTLVSPDGWEALSNAPVVERASAAGRREWRFAETPPLSSYLFAFVAGEFQVEEAERGGRSLRFLHRETDAGKVARNREAIFDLHQTALGWLEEYTGIPYPFPQFSFALIPAFQFGGMEHPGAIFYRDTGLLLDESATQADELGRASLIAHETAHMWFGDLVTMRWFDDVWMKEVFANFMAARIVDPSFPDLDHELRFLLAHFPAAYEVDRSAGANPIRQPLGNLAEAGSLYGAIIYQKAPIVVRQLEALLGEDLFREGVREYLEAHRYGNASWPDLIAVLDRRSDEDLAEWSRAWVEEPGRPTLELELDASGGRIASLLLRQSDPRGRARLWPQRLQVALGGEPGVRLLPVTMRGPSAAIAAAAGGPAPEWRLAGAAGLGYGRAALDDASRAWLLAHLEEIPSPLLRGVAWLALWDERLEDRVAPEALVETALRLLEGEEEELLLERLLADLRELCWRHLPPERRTEAATRIEPLLWDRLERARETRQKALWFRAYRDLALGEPAIARLRAVWSGEREIPGLSLSERDLSELALELAVREPQDWEEILAGQLARIENPDRRERFAFVMPALSADAARRDAFFAGLADEGRREHEPWVLEALRYLHHPLRAEASERYIRPSLELLPEIQRTGDIFFPKRWLDATLGGHRRPEAAALVRDYLDASPGLDSRLRGKLLQSADTLFRAAGISARP